jgi:hypothetical protein
VFGELQRRFETPVVVLIRSAAIDGSAAMPFSSMRADAAAWNG